MVGGLKPSVILLGSKPGSIVALSTMLKRGWNIRYVVTSPRFEHPWIAGPSLKEFATAQGLSVFDSQSELPLEQVDFVISYMFRLLVKPATLQLARRGALNFHAAPLPEFGGWAFYNVAILENATEYGCSCHFMDEKFDTGPILKVRRFPIDPEEETAHSLEAKAQAEMVRLFYDFCRLAESTADLPREPQDPKRMRYLSHERFDALKKIPSNADDETIQRHARAFWYPPYEGAYFQSGSLKIDVAPRLIKQQLAAVLHANDLAALKQVARDCEQA